jgi:hypothetical protein
MKHKWLLVDGRLVAYTDEEAWRLVPPDISKTRWIEMNSAEAALDGVPIGDNEVARRFPNLPSLPRGAFPTRG